MENEGQSLESRKALGGLRLSRTGVQKHQQLLQPTV